ncbi:probable peroxisomal acyl-coenzyme A oxidase 1 isoform X2 [Macrosteles quadrilineatus]|uniref:probable peroxisomal acyl-coenzyme A oxidase 1 isoform X2 n=1 Tax=Macrosteles quadrilineatus TaxID=74068 RepID=UPI0023E34809|nr:probable peroxisomal acyl-coenzyme A oxidase 1 isoform X2 [Macrosteles quadrilineatus]
MPSSKVNEDIQRERENCSFDVSELTNFLDGGPEKTKERKEMEDFFLNDPELKDKVPSEYLSHKEKYQEAVRKSCILFRKIDEWQNISNKGGGVGMYESVLGGALGSAIVKEGIPFSLHYVMFVPTLMGQATMEQQAYWIGRAWNCEIMGTYAQTELGHGTFIRGLETTAHYDPKTEEFVLNSPTLTSYKWWPGGLGHTANYAIVMAQLHSANVCHGIHAFIVQLRDEETHEPLPGIKIGEIGAKLGMNSINNGYLGFENFRIPREHMLMKNSKIMPDGTYIKAPSNKLTYGTMIFVRVALVKGVASSYLAKAVTIATRYSAVRRQSEMKPGEREPQILDYRTQQYKLFPALATSLAMLFSANWLWDMYNNVTGELEQGDMERLPELHAIACCLKAVCTSDAAQAIEVCRRACGGHGYMTCSNFPASYGHTTAAETYEGENTVLLLQTARYLIKAWHQVGSGEMMPPTVKYLLKKPTSKRWENKMACFIKAYQQVAAGNVARCASTIERKIRTGTSTEDAWNETSVQLVQCAEAHCRAFIVQTFVDTLNTAKATMSPELHEVLTQLCDLYTVYWMLRNLGDFLMFSALKPANVQGLQAMQDSLLQAIRPNAVSIVDGFDINDAIIASPLGAYDGNVYQRLFDEANKSPLNEQPVDESFHKYLKPFLKSNL